MAAPPTAKALPATKAYLETLLQKHEKGAALVYEDLLASWKAADAIMKDQDADNVVVVRRR
jgi:hypothetical protein